MAIRPPVSQEEFRGYIQRALDGRRIDNVVYRAESREVESVDGYRKHVPTGRRFIEITTSNV